MRTLIALMMAFLILSPLTATRAQAAQTQGSACNLEVVLLVDSSGSLTAENFETVKTFAAGIANSLPLGDDGVRVGVVQFGNDAQTVLDLSADGGAISGALGGLALMGGGSNFVNALQTGQAMLAAESRPYVTRTLVLITDGFSTADAQIAASDIRQADTVILAVGIGGGANSHELYNLAAASYYANTVFLTRFDTLGPTIGGLRDGLCRSAALVGGRIAEQQRDIHNKRYYIPAPNVTVTLLDEDMNVIRSTVTDAYGTYQFYVAAGTYNVRVDLPPGASFLPGFDGRIGPDQRAHRAAQHIRLHGVQAGGVSLRPKEEVGFTQSAADG